ncbi:MAG: Zn-dependent hydrolase, glyoxylase [Bacteroidetes bacterium]|jgi:glyoxylase-like metal-dependent hydrolase (beta-lactamase superfamily II)|nr:Zn-dependent hydrolase, glyoxylase [Bacteroidota bacterium]
MKLHAVNAGHFKLDGGAMFGVVPKSIWNKVNPADENNMCSWALRCLLIEDGNRLILVDNGMGDKQDQKFFGYYYLHGNDTLAGSLKKLGYSYDDITDVVLTHLHFDHCGGSIKYNSDRTKLEPAFKNATFYCNEKHWEWAIHPNLREKASFLKENILPIKESGQLKFIDKNTELLPGFTFKEVNGHTEAMMLPVIEYKDTTIAYMADLVPSAGHIPIPYVMGYDMRPLETLKEKELILNEAAENNWTLFFEHDPQIECVRLEKTEKGVRKKESFKLSEI